VGSTDSGSSTDPVAPETVAPAPRLDEGPGPDRGRVWAIVLASGVVAGLIAWGGGELTRGAFKPRLLKVQRLLQTFVQPTTQTQMAADLKNATLAFAILGAATGLAMGIGGGLAGRSQSRALTVGLGMGAIGALVGALVSWPLVALAARRIIPDPNDLATPLLIHSGIGIAIGAVGGAAFAAGMGVGRRFLRVVEGACLGALFGTVLVHLLGAAVFPDPDTLSRHFQGLLTVQNDESINPGTSSTVLAYSSLLRLLARLLVTVLVAVGVSWGLLSRGAGAIKPNAAPSPDH